MAFDFPASPTEGQEFTAIGGPTYTFTDGKWIVAGGGTGGAGGGGVAWVDITGKPSTFPPSTHSHPESEVTNLVADLALKAPLVSPALSGVPTVPTAAGGTNTTQAASTAFVSAAVSAAGVPPASVAPLMDGVAAVGATTKYAREDHVHPSDTAKEGVVSAGTTAQFYRGDKSWQTLDKSAVGLGNVDNTSDASKPISTATQTALNAKVAGPGTSVANAPAIFSGTTGKVIQETTYATFKTSLALTKSDVGLASVDNTSDAAKPVSTATQTALNLKADASSVPDVEAIQDIIGAMVTGNTETNISVTYDDTLGKLNFVVTAAGSGDVVGPAGSVTDAPALFSGTTGKLIKETTYATFKTSLALTKADVGLSNVDNTSDANKPVSTATATALGGKADTSTLTAHTSNTSNPHGTTKAQVGLGSANDTADMDKPVSTAQAAAIALKVDTTTFNAHTANVSNPHSVTKAQVGLGSVDNTADTAKPVSTAQQTALDAKVSLASVGASALTDGATVALDAALGATFTLTAAGNRTISAPTNPVAGKKIVIAHTASGADRTLALDTGAGGFRFGTDVASLTATVSAKTDYIGCIYNASASKWDVVAVSKGY